jgi:AraC-like DNA-binding protein
VRLIPDFGKQAGNRTEIMEYSKEKTLLHLQRGLDMPLQRIRYHGNARPQKSDEKSEDFTLTLGTRFFIILSGAKHMRCSLAKQEADDVYIKAGEVLYAKPNNWTVEIWDSRHEMLVVIFNNLMMRVVYIEHDGISPPPRPRPQPTIYYHTSSPPLPLICAIADALDIAAETVCKTGEKVAGDSVLLRALLIQVIAQVTADQPMAKWESSFLWRNIFTFMEESYTKNITREQVAGHFKISTAYLSRLCKQKLGMGFNHYITTLRLNLAVKLLHEAEWNINEIARYCGFGYTSYFIHVFRQKYACSPGEYRKSRLLNPKGK